MANESAAVRRREHDGGVAWREWGDESFRLAHELDRPILLDISAVWCHWCHVMDQTSYSDPAVIDLINRHYIALRVDNDRRPDINERCDMGGWPTTAFLTPAGDVLTGATYLTPEQMRSVLVRVADYYQRNKHDLAGKAIERQRPTAAPPAHGDVGLGPEIVAGVLESVRDNFDSVHGGFGDSPKFPQPDALDLALRDYQRSGNTASLSVVTTTLDIMAAGGIYDRVEGGFFRYSTTRDWRIPHFEKMLEGNAGLLGNYLRAFQALAEPRYADLARDVMRYLDAALSDQQQGGFYGSQDADEQYYALSLTERRLRPAPFVDRTLYVDWNALAVSAYLLAATTLEAPQAQRFTLRTLDRLWRLCSQPEGGIYHYYDDDAHLAGLLSAQVHLGMALLDAYSATGDTLYLQQARQLADVCQASLADPDGGFRDIIERPDDTGSLKKPLVPLPGNAAAARLLLRLSWLTGEEHYRTAAQRALARFSLSHERLGYFAAPYALAVDELLRPPLKLVIIGDASDDRLHALHAAALRLAEPWKIIQVLDPQRDADLFASSGFRLPEQPLLYPCVGATCLAPISDAAQLGVFVQLGDFIKE